MMKYKKLIVEEKQLRVVRRIISDIPYEVNEIHRSSLARLLAELNEAEVVADGMMPSDIVGMNSIVTFMDDKGRVHNFSIVSPDKSNIFQSRISILAPMALALFGYAQGDTVSWEFPHGVQNIQIVKVEQPAVAQKQEL